jgi:hypothetical protein
MSMYESSYKCQLGTNSPANTLRHNRSVARPWRALLKVRVNVAGHSSLTGEPTTGIDWSNEHARSIGFA